MLYAIAASATLIVVLAVPRSARARRRLVRLLRAQEVWAELIDRESQPRQECPLATRRLFRHLWISEMLMAGVDVLLGHPDGRHVGGGDREGLRALPQPVLP